MNRWLSRNDVEITIEDNIRKACINGKKRLVPVRTFTFSGRHAGGVMRAVEEAEQPDDWQLAEEPRITDEGGLFSIAYIFWNP